MGISIKGLLLNRDIREQVSEFAADRYLTLSAPEPIFFEKAMRNEGPRIEHLDFYFAPKGTIIFIDEYNSSLFSNCRFSKRMPLIQFELNETSMQFGFWYFRDGDQVGSHWFDCAEKGRMVDRDGMKQPFLNYREDEDIVMGLFSRLTAEFIGEAFARIPADAPAFRYRIIRTNYPE